MRLRMVVLFLGLTLLLAMLFNLPIALSPYLPREMFAVPGRPETQVARLIAQITLQWLIPAFAVWLFLSYARIRERLPRNFAMTLIAIGTTAFFVQLALKFLASLVPGGGMLFVANVVLSHVFLPIKILLFVGAVWLLTTLKPVPAASERA